MSTIISFKGYVKIYLFSLILIIFFICFESMERGPVSIRNMFLGNACLWCTKPRVWAPALHELGIMVHSYTCGTQQLGGRGRRIKSSSHIHYIASLTSSWDIWDCLKGGKKGKRPDCMCVLQQWNPCSSLTSGLSLASLPDQYLHCFWLYLLPVILSTGFEYNHCSDYFILWRHWWSLSESYSSERR